MIATVAIAWLPALRDAAASLASVLPTSGTTPLVPSTLDASLEVSALRAALREIGAKTTTILPRHASTIVAGRLAPRRGTMWRTIEVDDRVLRLDSRLEPGTWVGITMIDPRHRTGPFVLDLPARFLHPVDRLRLLARSDRDRLVADIAAAAAPHATLLLTPASNGWLAATTSDPIAAELWALALAERFHDRRVEMQGPWEDPVVQRATELGLGVVVPQRIRAEIAPGMPRDAVEFVRRTAMGLGIPDSMPPRDTPGRSGHAETDLP